MSKIGFGSLKVRNPDWKRYFGYLQDLSLSASGLDSDWNTTELKFHTSDLIAVIGIHELTNNLRFNLSKYGLRTFRLSLEQLDKFWDKINSIYHLILLYKNISVFTNSFRLGRFTLIKNNKGFQTIITLRICNLYQVFLCVFSDNIRSALTDTIKEKWNRLYKKWVYLGWLMGNKDWELSASIALRKHKDL